MIVAITRLPSPNLAQCELSYLKRQPIDYSQACLQHQAYRKFLQRSGAEVITLEANQHPDSVFVEDNALVLDEVAVMTSMGVASRQGENPEIAIYLADYRSIERISPPATIEGGDILKIGKRLYVGRSPRTNSAGIQHLTELTRPYGYQVIPVTLKDCLHLKSACVALDEDSIFMNPAWVNPDTFRDLQIHTVPSEEPWSANCLAINGHIGVSASFPTAADQLRRLGFDVSMIDNTEFIKAEAGLTCMSLLFRR